VDKNTPSESPALTFTEAHRLKELPDEISQLEAEIAQLSGLLADPDLFTRDQLKFERASAALVLRQKALSTAEEEWLTLEEKAGG
jgi:ATP-binding cassette subfamily F protein uup